MGDGFGDGLREGEVELGEGLNVWRAVGLGAGDAEVAGLGSIGRLVARVTLGFPPPLHSVPIKPRTLTTTINRSPVAPFAAANREGSLGLRRYRRSPSK